jgi:hypothetical protein
MASVVDPAADALWEAVSTETTAQGEVEHQPRTDAEWLAVRHHAVTLAEAANLLLIEGRVVANKLEDAHVPGILTAPEVQKSMLTASCLPIARTTCSLRRAKHWRQSTPNTRSACWLPGRKSMRRANAATYLLVSECRQPKWPAKLTSR